MGSDTWPDEFGLSRFTAAQEGAYRQALEELRQGRKATHWMWFIFPQLAGLGKSETARYYAIKSLREAEAYLAHPLLGPRLVECCRALLAVEGKSAADIFGYPDDLKLHSSMTLFARATASTPEFDRIMEKYFDGREDPNTVRLLGR